MHFSNPDNAMAGIGRMDVDGVCGRWAPIGSPWPTPTANITFVSFSTLGTMLLLIVILQLLGALPAWPYSQGWEYVPTGTLRILALGLLLGIVTGVV